MIVVYRVAKAYGGVRALSRVSFQVPAGGSLAIVGPSGSGKTTLLRLIAGLEVPDAGEIYLDGSPASTAGWAVAPHRRGLSFVFQTPALWPHLTVAQNIRFGLHGIPKPEAHRRLGELIERASLRGLERRFPHQLSGGEARRVALARALAPQPRYLLMDEPLTNLDPASKADLLSLIRDRAQQTGACLLYVTHDADEARTIAGETLVLHNGQQL